MIHSETFSNPGRASKRVSATPCLQKPPWRLTITFLPRVIGPPRRGTRTTTPPTRRIPHIPRPGNEHAASPDHATYPQHDAYADETADERYYAADLAAYQDDAGIADQHTAPEAAHDTMAAIPDLWARDDGRVEGFAPEVDAELHREPGFRRSADKATARRPLAVLAAVLLLTGGGLAATFLAKGSSGHNVVVSDRGGAPTILAATGPTKVKLDDGSATAPEDQDAALLNKNGKPVAGPVKVVSSEEQPVDLAQLPNSPDAAEGAQPLPQASSPFPEPKKVKTFLVHLDGTTLDDTQAAQSRSAVAPPVSAAPADAAAPLPATPRTAAKGSTTPKNDDDRVPDGRSCFRRYGSNAGQEHGAAARIAGCTLDQQSRYRQNHRSRGCVLAFVRFRPSTCRLAQ